MAGKNVTVSDAPFEGQPSVSVYVPKAAHVDLESGTVQQVVEALIEAGFMKGASE